MEGEKYLNISVCGGQLRFTAFLNTEKKKESDPDFRNTQQGIAVWVNKRKPEQPKVEDVL